MENTGFMVYWMLGEYPGCRLFGMDELGEALKYTEELRKSPGYNFIGMVSQNPNQVGKAGASTVLPEDYSWSKQYRGDQHGTVKSIMGGRSQE